MIVCIPSSFSVVRVPCIACRGATHRSSSKCCAILPHQIRKICTWTKRNKFIDARKFAMKNSGVRKAQYSNRIYIVENNKVMKFENKKVKWASGKGCRAIV